MYVHTVFARSQAAATGGELLLLALTIEIYELVDTWDFAVIIRVVTRCFYTICFRPDIILLYPYATGIFQQCRCSTVKTLFK